MLLALEHFSNHRNLAEIILCNKTSLKATKILEVHDNIKKTLMVGNYNELFRKILHAFLFTKEIELPVHFEDGKNLMGTHAGNVI